MRLAFAPALFALSMLGSGCALMEDASRNVAVAIKTPIERHKEIARNKRWAEAAWMQVYVSGTGSFSDDHAHGFKDGYAEYLYRGGDGEPPLAPPLEYRHLRYQNPQGYQAIQDWFNGYRHGAAVARDSGARRWITGPSALPPEAHAAIVVDSHPFMPARLEEIKHEPAPTPPPLPPVVPIAKPQVESREPTPGPFAAPLGETLEFPPAPAYDEAIDRVKAKITRIAVNPPASESSPVPQEPVPEDTVRARITGVIVVPPVDPVRARIMGIKVAPD